MTSRPWSQGQLAPQGLLQISSGEVREGEGKGQGCGELGAGDRVGGQGKDRNWIRSAGNGDVASAQAGPTAQPF